MENQEQLKQEILNGLREILKSSLPHCDDGNPNEKDFIAINNTAYEVLKRVERLRV